MTFQIKQTVQRVTTGQIKFSVSYIARKHRDLWKMHKLSFESCSEHCCTIEMDWNMLIFWEYVYFSVSYHIPFQMQMRLFRQILCVIKKALILFSLACTIAVTKSRPQYSRSCTGLDRKAGNRHYYWHIQIHPSVVENTLLFSLQLLVISAIKGDYQQLGKLGLTAAF